MSQPRNLSSWLASTLPRGVVDSRVPDLVLERVTSERRVIPLQIEGKPILKAVLPKERENGRNVEVVLVFGRLFRLGFDQELVVEPDVVRVICGHSEESRYVVQFPAHVGVQERHAPLASPQNTSVHAEQMSRSSSVIDTTHYDLLTSQTPSAR